MNNTISLNNFLELIERVKQIPYGRNANRSDFSLVLKENKGTCSSKHAFLKDFADKNQIENVHLFIGIFKMNEQNTPKIAPLLTKNQLAYIPEAHCYLKVNGKVVDATTENSFFTTIEKDVLEEIEIQPNQVAEFKVTLHQKYIKDWITNKNISLSFDEIWTIREQCIQKLSE